MLHWWHTWYWKYINNKSLIFALLKFIFDAGFCYFYILVEYIFTNKSESNERAQFHSNLDFFLFACSRKLCEFAWIKCQTYDARIQHFSQVKTFPNLIAHPTANELIQIFDHSSSKRIIFIPTKNAGQSVWDDHGYPRAAQAGLLAPPVHNSLVLVQAEHSGARVAHFALVHVSVGPRRG